MESVKCKSFQQKWPRLAIVSWLNSLLIKVLAVPVKRSELEYRGSMELVQDLSLALDGKQYKSYLNG